MISEGEGEPVEFLYGADDHLDLLEERLRTIYPHTFEIDRIVVDPTAKIIPPKRYHIKDYRNADTHFETYKSIQEY
jgi:hypothetical protein